MSTAAELDRCTAWHRSHDCGTPGACRRALLDMLAEVDERARQAAEARDAQARRELAELARCNALVEHTDPDPAPAHGTPRPNPKG